MDSSLQGKKNLTIISVSSLLAISLFGDSLLYNVLPLYAEELKIPLTAVGLILSMNRWVRLISNPLSKRVFLSYGLYKPLKLFTAVGILSTFMYAQSLGLLLFLLARILWGITWSHLRLGAYLIIQAASKARLGLSMGIMNAVTRLGSSFTVFFGGYLVDRLGYRSGMLIMASLSLTALPLVFWLTTHLKSDPTRSIDQMNVEKKEKGSTRTQSSPWFYYLIHFFNMFITGFAIASLSIILRERIGVEASFFGQNLGVATLTGLLLSIQYSSNLVIAPLAGYISDTWGRYKSLVLIIVLRIILLLIFALTRDPFITAFIALLIFFTGNSLKTILEAAAAHLSCGTDGAGTMSTFASFEDLGLASGPLFGYFLGVHFSFNSVYILGALALAFSLLINRIKNRPGSLEGPSRNL